MLNDQRGAVRSVMDMSLFLMLLLSGLLYSASGVWRDYYFINRNMTWSEAQSYCRERFTDLATVDAKDDVSRMMSVVDVGYNGSVWIGLKRATQSRWGWSVGDDSLTQYTNWDSENASSGGACVYHDNRTWFSASCSTKRYFVCHDATGKQFIWAKMYRNWTDAQSYCRRSFLDLVTIRSFTDQQRLNDAVFDNVSIFWIGLFSDSWQWSDQWNLFFRNWAAGQPSNSSASGDCVAMATNNSGKWAHDSCDLKRPFICHGNQTAKRQIIRLKFSCDGKCNLNDSSQQTTAMNQINKKMTNLGLESNNDIIWLKDEGGEVFHMEINETAKSNIECDGN